MRFLHKVLSGLDTDKVGVLDENDFKWGMQSGKIYLNEEEVRHLIKNYNKQGQVAYKQFLNDLRGKLN